MSLARTANRDWSERVDRLVLVLFYPTLLALAIHKIVTWDVWWQIRVGEWILAHGIPTTDPFSYGFPDRPWIELRWLYCVAVQLLAAGFGLNALIVAKSVLLLATFVLLHRIVPFAPRWAVAAGLLGALWLMHVRFYVRPELLTFLFATLTLFGLLRYKWGGSARWIYALPLLQVVWANSHTLAILGPILVISFAAAEFVQPKIRPRLGGLAQDPYPIEGQRLRPLLWTALGCVFAMLVTPYFVRGLFFPFTLLGEIGSGSFLSSTISEFQSPLRFAGWSFPFVGYVVVTAVSALTFILNRRRLALSVLGWWSAFFFLSTLAQRNGALFGIVAAMAMTLNFAQWAAAAKGVSVFERRIPEAVRAVCLTLVLVLPVLTVTDRLWVSYHSGHAFGFGVRDDRYPIRAMAFVRQENLQTPVLGALGDGGYLLYEGGERSVYIDGRLEVYGSDTVETALRVLSAGQNLTETAGRFGVRTAVLRLRMERAIAVLESDPRWIPVYFDRSHVVYVQRSDATERLGFDWSDPPLHELPLPSHVDPPDWLAGLWPRVSDVNPLEIQGSFLIRRGNLDLGESRFRRALELVPSSPTSRLHLGMVEEARGRDVEARALLDGLDEKLLESEEMLGLRSWIASLAGNTERAYELGKQATTRGVADPVERKNLARLAIRNEEFEEAEAVLLELGVEFPSDPEVWGLLGDLEFIRQRYDEALGYYATTLALGASEARVHFNIGTIHARHRRFTEARASFERALAADSGYARARQALGQLESMGH